MNVKAIAGMIAFLFIVSGLPMFIPLSSNAQATTSGDVYSGSGDWAVTTWADYSGETLTVYGNITVTGRLNLTNTMLTIDQPSSMARKISVTGGGSIYFNGANWLGSTNKTPGKYNTWCNVSGGGYIWSYASTFDGIAFNINSALSYFVANSVIYSGIIWNNYGLGWETGEPLDTGPLIISSVIFANTNTTGQPYTSIITAGNNLTVEQSTFTNITLPSGSPDSCSYIRNVAQNNVHITNNSFANSSWAPIFFRALAPYTMTNSLIYGNTFHGIGFNLSTLGYGAYLKGGTASNCFFSSNIFDMIRNGSVGILIDANGWGINNNRFDFIDASGLTTSGATRGVSITPPGNTVFDGNIFNNIQGPHIDTGAGAMGIKSEQAGGFTVTHSVFRNVTNLGCGISVVDPISFAGLPNILIHANTFSKARNASGSIAIFGGLNAVVSWNNMSDIDGSSVGIMFDSTAHNGTAHNNTVTGMFDSPNVWPNWQIVVGAYTYYAGGSIYGPKFTDNHATGGTMVHPEYNITGEKLGGGWWPNARMLIDTSDSAIIHYQNANVTLRHDGQLLGITKDSASQSMRFYNNGTSWAWFNKTDLNHHFLNVSPSNLRLIVYPADQAINASFISSTGGAITWNATGDGSAIATFVLYGVVEGAKYSLYKDGVWVETVRAFGGTVSFNFSGSWSEHQFEIRGGMYSQAIVNLGAVLGIMMALAVVVPVIVTTAEIVKEKRKFKQEDVINTAIFIVVGVSLLSVVYALLP